MISSFLINLIYEHQMLINFFLHGIVFLGAFYVALHNRSLPRWHVTTIWYIGLASLLSVITVVFDWNFGPDFPMSYTNLGIITETFSNAALAFTAGAMLYGTILKDIRGAKKRARTEEY